MENTKKILEVIRQELNTNPIAQEALSIAAARAEELNYTAEQWEQAKISFMSALFYRLALDHEDIKRQIGADVWKMFNAESAN
ncbi:MAG: hypothetical protein OSJ39_00935 [Clostridia bacterium]|uniref:hypothetical protein n=1 Tax=Sporofaciens sp. JLR.KK001 TaxID=3112621 RepID=UPI002FEE9283|nr:hypothetical protein [Clostridia bacterium]